MAWTKADGMDPSYNGKLIIDILDIKADSF